MHVPADLHSWTVTPKEAIAIQKKLSNRVRQEKPERAIRLVAGVDAAFSSDGSYCLAGVVVWDMAARVVVETRTAALELTLPYIPGLLSFREAPAILEALRQLNTRPDLLLGDGQGIAHPRGLGIASHLGLVLDLPAAGCAKSRLFGHHRQPGPQRGEKASLLDPRGRIIGTVLRTRDRVKPLFVSVGHKIDLPTVEMVVLRCGAGYRLPEPTRLADRLVTRFKRQREGGALAPCTKFAATAARRTFSGESW